MIWKKNYRLKIFNFYQQLVPTFKLKYNPTCDFLSLKQRVWLSNFINKQNIINRCIEHIAETELTVPNVSLTSIEIFEKIHYRFSWWIHEFYSLYWFLRKAGMGGLALLTEAVFTGPKHGTTTGKTVFFINRPNKQI